MAKKVERVNKCVFMYSITIQYLLTQATFQPSNQCKNLQFELYSSNFPIEQGEFPLICEITSQP